MYRTIRRGQTIDVPTPCRIRLERLTADGARVFIEALPTEDGALKDAATILPLIAENDEMIDTARNFG